MRKKEEERDIYIERVERELERERERNREERESEEQTERERKWEIDRERERKMGKAKEKINKEMWDREVKTIKEIINKTSSKGCSNNQTKINKLALEWLNRIRVAWEQKKERRFYVTKEEGLQNVG